MNQKVDIAAIGDSDIILLFNAVGIKTFAIKDIDQVERTIHQLANQKVKIIYVTEEIYEAIPETIEKYKTSPFPVIMPIPSNEESKEIGLKKIKENVEKAIGFDIF